MIGAPAGQEPRMDDDTRDRTPTTPPAPTHEASSPPSNPPPDEDAIREGEDKLGQAGAGH